MFRFIRTEYALLVGLLVTALSYGPAAWLFAGVFTPTLYSILFVILFITMLMLSFAAVCHADHLAALLGEPYGTLILTIAVITI